jgi:hypothetical protein
VGLKLWVVHIDIQKSPFHFLCGFIAIQNSPFHPFTRDDVHHKVNSVKLRCFVGLYDGAMGS